MNFKIELQTNKSDSDKHTGNYDLLCKLLEIAIEEYKIERDRKSSYENRAGLILGFAGVICFFWFQQITPQELLVILFKPITIFEIMVFICGIGFYLSLASAVISSLLIFRVRTHRILNTNQALSYPFAGLPISEGLGELIDEYRETIADYRDSNKKRSSILNWNIFFTGTAILLSIVWYFLKGV